MKAAWYTKKWVTVSLHAAAWVLLFSLPYLLRSPENERPPASKETHGADPGFYFSLLMNVSWILLFYLNAYILIPRFIYKKRYWKFTLAHFFIFIALLAEVYLLVALFFKPDHYNNRTVFFNFLIYLFIFALSTAYQLIKDKVKNDKLEQEKQNAVLKTELSLLRSQVSPHFMFNVLNNMVSLARKQSDLLEPSLIKLSSLMRYMLYEADEEKVSIEKEMDYLQSYIDLQQQRFGKKVQVNVHMHTMDDHYQLEPMLLIPFVENAFKHGTGMIQDAQIDIDLEAEKNVLQFTVRNKYNPASVEIKDKTSGIGLANVKRRLNLLYGKNHSLAITTANDWFVASLNINLS
ncbi:MAG: histidine kinase [Chitinophagaceae bacterium]